MLIFLPSPLGEKLVIYLCLPPLGEKIVIYFAFPVGGEKFVIYLCLPPLGEGGPLAVDEGFHFSLPHQLPSATISLLRRAAFCLRIIAGHEN